MNFGELLNIMENHRNLRLWNSAPQPKFQVMSSRIYVENDIASVNDLRVRRKMKKDTEYREVTQGYWAKLN
jgi:hypothetical protein